MQIDPVPKRRPDPPHRRRLPKTVLHAFCDESGDPVSLEDAPLGPQGLIIASAMTPVPAKIRHRLDTILKAHEHTLPEWPLNKRLLTAKSNRRPLKNAVYDYLGSLSPSDLVATVTGLDKASLPRRFREMSRHEVFQEMHRLHWRTVVEELPHKTKVSLNLARIGRYQAAMRRGAQEGASGSVTGEISTDLARNDTMYGIPDYIAHATKRRAFDDDREQYEKIEHLIVRKRWIPMHP